jgi:hypothetical protein
MIAYVYGKYAILETATKYKKCLKNKNGSNSGV